MSSNIGDSPIQNLDEEQKSELVKKVQTAAAPKRNKRSWVSINLMGTLMGMVITGVMSYIFAYSEATAGIHTWFGISFIVLMVFHLRNNIKTLITYICQHKGKQLVGISVAVSLVLTLGVMLSLPPFSSVLELGQNLRKSISVEEGTYQTLTTRIGESGIPIEIELRRGEHYESDPQPLFLGLTYTSVPQVAFWLEDMEGKYLGTLYVTQKISNASFVSTEDIFNTVSRPESLPYWAHQRGVNYGDDIMMPAANNTDLDGMTGATPLGNYDIRSTADTDLRQFKVMMEINRSYDFNGFYTKDKYPDDAIYSGSGSSGQPSVIYTAEVNLDDNQHSYLMSPVGHGHYSGKNGMLYTDMEDIDTALQLIKRVVVEI
jgi:hypothetical protein